METTSKLPIKALGDTLIAVLVREEVKTTGGLLLKESEDSQIQRVKIVDIALTILHTGLKIGDVLYVKKRSGYPLVINNEIYIVLTQQEILAVSNN